MLLFSLLIASAGAASTTGIGSSPSPSLSLSPIKNHCGSDGVVPNSYMVTLKTPDSKDRSAPTSTGLNTNKGDLSYLSGWFQQYNQDSTNEAGSTPTSAVHYFIQTQLAVAVEASDDAAMRMATDPAVFSVEYDCYSSYRHLSSSLPERGDSLPGHDSLDLYDEVARRLSVQVNAPWGIDRIDTDGGAIDGIYDDGDLTGSDVRVYVVDTGVQGSHQDFGGRVVSGHTAFVHPECASCQAVNGILPADGTGCQGHGTHVASTVGGLKHGVAKNVTIVPVFSCFGFLCSNGRVGCGRTTDISASLE